MHVLSCSFATLASAENLLMQFPQFQGEPKQKIQKATTKLVRKITRLSCVELRRWGFGGDGSPFSHQKLGFRLGERPLASKIGAIRPEV